MAVTPAPPTRTTSSSSTTRPVPRSTSATYSVQYRVGRRGELVGTDHLHGHDPRRRLLPGPAGARATGGRRRCRLRTAPARLAMAGVERRWSRWSAADHARLHRHAPASRSADGASTSSGSEHGERPSPGAARPSAVEHRRRCRVTRRTPTPGTTPPTSRPVRRRRPTAAVAPPAATPRTIAEIQGTGSSSPHVGELVVTEGVVTASYPTGGFNGFVIQTEGTGGLADAGRAHGLRRNLRRRCRARAAS